MWEICWRHEVHGDISKNADDIMPQVVKGWVDSGNSKTEQMGNKWQMIRDKCEARNISDKQTIPYLNDAELVTTPESDLDLIAESVYRHRMGWQQKKKP